MFEISKSKIFIAFISILLFFFRQLNYPENLGLTIHLFNVGQGDSILFVSPDNYTLLVDAGPDSQTVSLLNSYWKSNNLDTLVITHFDSDHIGGLADVLEKYHFKNIIANSDLYIKEFGYQVQSPNELPIQLGCCVTLQFYTHSQGKSSNETSLAFKISYKGFSAFFDGDLPSAIEDSLANRVGEVTLLKMAHHGSKMSSSLFFLRTITPKLCLISVGKNNYGHPNEEVLLRAEAEKCEIFRTDTAGTISITTNGIETFSLAPPLFLW